MNINFKTMKSSFQIKSVALLLLVVALFFSGCVKDEFDTPPADGEDPAGIVANQTIAGLKSIYNIGSNEPKQVTEDWIVSGIVISDDKEGNFYKQIIVQDSTAGILIRIDQTNLYTDFPVGRKVFIKCKGLWVSDFEGLVQMGGTVDLTTDPQNPSLDFIPSSLVSQYILKGKYNQFVTPLSLTINQLNPTYQNMLVKLSDVEFDEAEIGEKYADAVTLSSENRKLVDCNGNEVFLRTSGYAQFANDTIPGNSGSITVIYSEFRGDAQLYINSPKDVVFNNTNRCTGSGIINVVSIASIRSLYSGSDVVIGNGKKIKGTVISDRSNGNIDTRNMVIQDNSAGIVVRFASTHSFNLGDEVEIDVSAQDLTDFNGLVQVDFVPNAKATVTGNGNIIPQSVTIAQILASYDDYESELVEIANVQLSGNGGQFDGDVSLNDGSGSLNMFTRTAASFSSSNYPTGTRIVTGIVSKFNSPQLNIRRTNDIQ